MYTFFRCYWLKSWIIWFSINDSFRKFPGLSGGKCRLSAWESSDPNLSHCLDKNTDFLGSVLKYSRVHMEWLAQGHAGSWWQTLDKCPDFMALSLSSFYGPCFFLACRSSTVYLSRSFLPDHAVLVVHVSSASKNVPAILLKEKNAMVGKHRLCAVHLQPLRAYDQ